MKILRKLYSKSVLAFQTKKDYGCRMAIFEYRGMRPEIGKDCYIAESAEVIGNVRLGSGCYVGPGAKVRGDYGRIIIGDNTSIEENCVIHARPGETTTIGSNVTIGHGAIVHTPKEIGDFCVIGMGAVVSDFAVLGEWVALGEGAVVPNNKEIAAGKVAVGVPAKVIADVTGDYKKQWMKYKKMYVDLAATYKRDLRGFNPGEEG